MRSSVPAPGPDCRPTASKGKGASLISSAHTCTSAMDAFRTPPAEAPATLPPPPPSEPSGSSGAPGSPTRTCIVCSKPISGRIEKRACSGRCRILASRLRRHGALLDRLAAAEEALARAAAAVEELREVAERGPHATASLTVGSSR